MKIWHLGKFENIEIGQKVLVARCGSGQTCFGEFGKLVRTTHQHLVFETESGAQVKTKIDSLETVGIARKEGYIVSLKTEGREEDKNFIRTNVTFWDEKKARFVNK